MDAPQTNPTPASTPKSHTGALVGLAIIITLIVAGGGVYAWQYMVGQEKDGEINRLEQQVNNLNTQVGQLQGQIEEKQMEEDQLLTDLKNLFVVKYNKNINDVSVTISQQTDDYIYGSVRLSQDPNAVGEGGYFYAAYVRGNWQLVIDGNGVVPCELLADYNFPESMKNQCVPVEDYSALLDWPTYQNDAYNYSIKYPATWDTSGEDDNFHFNSTLPWPAGGIGLSVIIRNVSLEDFIQEYNSLDQGIEGFSKIVSQEVATINEVSAIMLTGTTALGINKDFIFIINNGLSYIIEYNKAQAEHHAMINSFQFTN